VPLPSSTKPLPVAVCRSPPYTRISYPHDHSLFAVRASPRTRYTSRHHFTVTSLLHSRDQGYFAVSSNLPGDPYRQRSNLASASSTRRAPLSRSSPSLYREYLTTHARNGTTAAEWRACNAQVRTIRSCYLQSWDPCHASVPSISHCYFLWHAFEITVVPCSHGAISITHFVPSFALLLPVFTIAPAMTCVNGLACLELLHPGFCAVACIGVPGPKIPPTKNSSPYRHPMPTFIVSRSIVSRSGQPVYLKRLFASATHSRSCRCCHTMPALVHHADL
jgi:hypothetical protein